MPVLYLSHGAPPLADDDGWTAELAQWSADLPRPTSILVVSAHWEAAPLTVGATETVPLTYDFWGFPERYYEVTYPAPGAPELARDVRALLSRPGQEVHQDPNRGLDHGAYVPLVEMFPEADIPVLQVSMPSLDPQELFAVGRRLAPLRDSGVLIIGSGFTTHNLSRAQFGDTTGAAQGWSREFDAWAKERVESRRRRLGPRLRARRACRADRAPADRALRAAVRLARRHRGHLAGRAHRRRRLLVRPVQALVRRIRLTPSLRPTPRLV